ncbi:MAG: indole-3-glycerol phosphate synthase TrpC [Lachnospiraceae bacterium]|nr:indole-3-glycerol phosphate synthase TrpC [Lachnospiraceae bacterium]
MDQILATIAEKTTQRIAERKKEISPEEIRQRAMALPKDTGFPFEKALAKDGMSFICEVKKASPSKGVIAEEFDPLAIAKAYEQAGASAISCLTEPFFFLGSDAYLQSITETVHIPVLRKDFTVDPYMIYEAKLLGASAVLLIVSILSEEQLKEYMQIAEDLGLSALVETHDEGEIETALRCGARIIGVNNRNLKDFSVDTGNSARLRKQVPDNVIFVSESGIKTPEDIRRLEENRVDAVLIGELLMRSENKKEMLDALRGI